MKLRDIQEERFNQALGDKSFEDYAKETSEAYTRAYGESNISEVVKKYIDSQEASFGWLKAGTSYAGMAAMIGADLCPLPAGKVLKVVVSIGKPLLSTAGLLGATYGSAALSYWENSTKEGGITEEDRKAMLEELKLSTEFLVTGIGIGGVSSSAFRTIAQYCPKLVALAGEIGVDGALSLATTYAITGEWDVSGEGLAQLANVLTGIIRARGSVNRFLDTHAGEVKPREQESNDIPGRTQDPSAPTVKPDRASVSSADIKEIVNNVMQKFKKIADVEHDPSVKAHLETILKYLSSCNEEELAKFDKILDLVEARHPKLNEGTPVSMYIDDEILSIISLGKENLDFVLDVLNFKNVEETLDAEYNNLFRIKKEDIPKIKILMELSSENEFLQNIHNIIEVVHNLPDDISLDRLKEMFRLKDETGNFVLNMDTIDKHMDEKFKYLSNKIDDNDIKLASNDIKNRFQNISDSDLSNLLACVKDKRTKDILQKVLGLKDKDGNFLFNLHTIKATMEFAKDNPEKLDMLNKLIEKRISNPLENKIFDEAWTRVLMLATKDGSENIIKSFLTMPAEDFSWRRLGGASGTIAKSQNPKVIKTVNEILKVYSDDNSLFNLLSCVDDETVEFINRAVRQENDFNRQVYSAQDIVNMIQEMSLAKDRVSGDVKLQTKIDEVMNKAVRNKLPSSIAKLLPDYVLSDMENKTNICDFILSSGALTMRGSSRFGEYGLLAILENLPQPIQNKHLDYVKTLMENPDITTTEIIRNIKGQTIEVKNRLEFPFGKDGEFKAEYDRICGTEAWKNLPQNTKEKLFEYMSRLVEQDPNRFKRLVESGYFELCSQGKCDINDLLSNINTNKFFSKNYLNDVKRIYSGEPLVKEFPSGTTLEVLAKQVPDGEVAHVDGKLYVNDNGKMVQLNMTKEKFEELFPLEGRFNTKQQGLGDCWLISALDNLMDIPGGRAKLYQLFSQEGNDIIVTFQERYIGESPYVLRFKDGKPISNGNKQVSACQGLQLLEQAYGVKRKGSVPEDQGPIDVANLVDIDAQMDALASGRSVEFISTILGYTHNPDDFTFRDSDNNIKGYGFTKMSSGMFEAMDDAKFNQCVIDVFEKIANDENYLLHFSTNHVDSTASRKEKTLNEPYSLYSNHAYTVKGYDAERGMVYYTNPWNSNDIVEMDVYSFLSYIDTISYLEIN